MTDLPTPSERFIQGILPENPVYRQLLGLCPTLAVTNGLKPALTMAVAVGVVLLSANIIISLIRNLLKPHLRIVVFTLTIATFVTIVDRLGKNEYRGELRCSAANLVTDVQGCTYGCLGFGDCARACKFDALHVRDGLATVDYEKCVDAGINADRISRDFIVVKGNAIHKIVETAFTGNFGTIVVGRREVISFTQEHFRGRFSEKLIKSLDNMAVWVLS